LRKPCGGLLAGVLLAVSMIVAPVLAGPLIPQADGGVIDFALCDLDSRGLIGPEGGKRALDYEFCIPEGAAFEADVRAIDTTAQFMLGSPGRIGCRPDQILVLGNTHRPDFAFVLQALAELPYVERIQQAFFE
jgi:hypothetical protein